MLTGRSGLDEATNQRDAGFDTNALSRMSTCRSRAEVMRRITLAPEAARTLYRRYQRAEAGRGDAMGRRGASLTRTRYRRCQRVRVVQPRWGDGSPRRRVQHGCRVADVNMLGTGRSEATSRGGNGSGTDALSQMSTCRGRAAVRRRITEATGSAWMPRRGCQHAGHGPKRGDESRRQRSRRERSIADVNASKPGHGEAMDHRGDKFGADAPLRLLTRW